MSHRKNNLFEIGAKFEDTWVSDNQQKPKAKISTQIKPPQKHQLHLAKEKRRGKVVTIRAGYIRIRYVFIFVLSLHNVYASNFKVDQNQTLYTCIVFENFGTQLVVQNPFKRYELSQYKKKFAEFIKDPDHPELAEYSTNYYKIVQQNNQKILYGYDIFSNKLVEIRTTDSKQRLATTEEFDKQGKTIKKCTIKYTETKNTLTAKEICSDGSSQVTYYEHKDHEYHSAIMRNYFNHGKLIKAMKINKFSEFTIYDTDHKMIRKGEVIQPSDFCTPFLLTERK